MAIVVKSALLGIVALRCLNRKLVIIYAVKQAFFKLLELFFMVDFKLASLMSTT